MTAALITGYHRCDNCGREVEHVQRERGYWLCDACWTVIVPPQDIALVAGQKRDAVWRAATQTERKKIAAYILWLRNMQVRKPQPVQQSARPASVQQAGGDEDWPFCACGQSREPMRWVPPGRQINSLFGGPYRQHCLVCEAKLRVQVHYDLLLNGIHPGWDDEQWLDSLEQLMPEVFKLGVLPDYWFRLRYPALYEDKRP